MKIEQIQQIIEIARTGSLNKAAKNLYIAQPNLSLSLKNLETELNVQIFDRTQKGMVLTSIGQQLLFYAEPIYRQFLQMPELFKTITKKPKVTFRLSNAFIKFVTNLYIETFNTFAEDNVQVFYREDSVHDVLVDVASQISDIGILYFSSLSRSRMLKLIEYKHLNYHKLIDDTLKIIIGAGNPLYYNDLEFVTLDMLPDYPIVGYEDQHNLNYTPISAGFRNLSRQIVVNNRASMIELLAGTDAVNIGTLSETAYMHTEFYNNLKTIPIKNLPFSMEVGWVCREDYEPDAIAKFFLRRLLEVTNNPSST